MDIDISKTACFTGHRPQKLGGYDYNNPTALKVKECLRFTIYELIKQGYHTFISGGALGVDQWAAQIVLDLKKEFEHLKLVMAIPCKGQESRWPASSQNDYRNIIVQADERIMVSDKPYTYSCMQKRNEWMVDHSSTVIAIWDGTSGGTANCVNYAKKKEKSIILIPPRD